MASLAHFLGIDYQYDTLFRNGASQPTCPKLLGQAPTSRYPKLLNTRPQNFIPNMGSFWLQINTLCIIQNKHLKMQYLSSSPFPCEFLGSICVQQGRVSPVSYRRLHVAWSLLHRVPYLISVTLLSPALPLPVSFCCMFLYLNTSW